MGFAKSPEFKTGHQRANGLSATISATISADD
jgi:hypothetical protein